MVRSYAADLVDPAVTDRIVAAALRAPSAGNTGGTSWVILSGRAETDRYWEATTDESWRTTSPRADGLRRAPVILLAYASADEYVARYAEPDKADPQPGHQGRGLARAVLDRRRRLRRHDGLVGRRGRWSRRVHSGQFPGRGRTRSGLVRPGRRGASSAP